MEISILSAVAFKVACPTAAHFLLHFEAMQQTFDTSDSDGPCQQAHIDLAWYAIKLALLDIGMLRFMPSHLSAAALFLGRRISGMQSAWPHLMVPLNNRSEGVLEAIVYRLQQLLEAA